MCSILFRGKFARASVCHSSTSANTVMQYLLCRMPVFLYNYSDRTMHGIFKAVSEGSLEINPKGEMCCLAVLDSSVLLSCAPLASL